MNCFWFSLTSEMSKKYVLLYLIVLLFSSTIGIYCIAHTMFRGSKKKYQLSWSDSQWQNVIKHHCMNHHIGSWWLSYVCLPCRYTATILIFHQQYLSNICKRLFPMGGRRSQYSFEYISEDCWRLKISHIDSCV